MDYKGYKIQQSIGHGQNLAGNKKTATMRVIDEFNNGYLIKKQFSFLVHDTAKKEKAIKKCMKYIDENLMCKQCDTKRQMDGTDMCQWCILQEFLP